MVLVSSSFINHYAFSQAEMPELYNNFIKINDNARKIKAAKIKLYAEIMSAGGKDDTLNIYQYDTNGILIKRLIENTDTTRKENKTFYENYNYIYKDGRLIQRIDTINGDIWKTILYYDDLGNISKEEIYFRTKLAMDMNYDYDELGRLIESDEVNYYQSCKIVEKYAYDSYNNMAKRNIKNDCKDLEGKANEYKFAYKYDKKSNIIEKQSTYPSGGYNTEQFKYDPKGNMTEYYESNSKNEYSEAIYTYDPKTNTKLKGDRKEVIGGFTTLYAEKFIFDNKGNLIEDQNFNPNGELMLSKKYYYEFY